MYSYYKLLVIILSCCICKYYIIIIMPLRNVTILLILLYICNIKNKSAVNHGVWFCLRWNQPFIRRYGIIYNSWGLVDIILVFSQFLYRHRLTSALHYILTHFPHEVEKKGCFQRKSKTSHAYYHHNYEHNQTKTQRLSDIMTSLLSLGK